MHTANWSYMAKLYQVATFVHMVVQFAMQVRDYVTQLEDHLAEVHRQSQRLIERQSKMGSSLSDFWR